MFIILLRAASLQQHALLPSGTAHSVLSLLQWTAEVNAAITQKFFAWLVGPLEVQEAEIEYEGQKQTWKSGVQIKKCRYLEQSGCKGMCINMCKVSKYMGAPSMIPVLAGLGRAGEGGRGFGGETLFSAPAPTGHWVHSEQ